MREKTSKLSGTTVYDLTHWNRFSNQIFIGKCLRAVHLNCIVYWGTNLNNFPLHDWHVQWKVSYGFCPKPSGALLNHKRFAFWWISLLWPASSLCFALRWLPAVLSVALQELCLSLCGWGSTQLFILRWGYRFLAVLLSPSDFNPQQTMCLPKKFPLLWNHCVLFHFCGEK